MERRVRQVRAFIDRLACRFFLALVKELIMCYEVEPWGVMSPKDKEDLRKLWDLHDRLILRAARPQHDR